MTDDYECIWGPGFYNACDSPEGAEHHTQVRVFAEGSYKDGTLVWGWSCGCGDEDLGYATATSAAESAHDHERMP